MGKHVTLSREQQGEKEQVKVAESERKRKSANLAEWGSALFARTALACSCISPVRGEESRETGDEWRCADGMSRR